MTDEKHFDEWNVEKKRLHVAGRMPTINAGDILWCAMGENVGVEINGKGKAFMRPVLIIRKLSRLGFVGLPLTSQLHEGPWYAHFRFQGRDEYAVFAQMRTFSVRRLYRKMGEADDADTKNVRILLAESLFE